MRFEEFGNLKKGVIWKIKPFNTHLETIETDSLETKWNDFETHYVIIRSFSNISNEASVTLFDKDKKERCDILLDVSDMERLIKIIPVPESLLKNNMVVKDENNFYLYRDERYYRIKEKQEIKNWKYNLSFNCYVYDGKVDIQEIYEIKDPYNYIVSACVGRLIEMDNLTLIWKRDETPTYTIEEAESKFKIKIQN